jgi:hypothetical protein
MPNPRMPSPVLIKIPPENRITPNRLEANSTRRPIILIILTVNELAPIGGKSTAVMRKLRRATNTVITFEISEDGGYAGVLHAPEPVKVRTELVADAVLYDLQIFEAVDGLVALEVHCALFDACYDGVAWEDG